MIVNTDYVTNNFTLKVVIYPANNFIKNLLIFNLIIGSSKFNNGSPFLKLSIRVHNLTKEKGAILHDYPQLLSLKQ